MAALVFAFGVLGVVVTLAVAVFSLALLVVYVVARGRELAGRALRYVAGRWGDWLLFSGSASVFLVTLAALLFPSVTLPALAGLVRS